MPRPKPFSVILYAVATLSLAAGIFAMPPNEEAIAVWRAQGVLEEKLEMYRQHQISQGLHLESWSPPLSRQSDGSAAGVAVDSAHLLVLLVEFPDLHMTVGSTNAFDSALFSDASIGGVINPTGSMTDYYHEVSYGAYHITGECYGPYMADFPYDYYVGDQNGMDGGSELLIDEIAAKADDEVDFSEFVSEASRIDGLVIIHAGPGAEATGYGIWSHRSTITQFPIIRDTTVIHGYIMNPELQPYMGLSPIGVFCHEYGHVLGLPDLYDIDRDPQSRGLGDWCLMAGGSWNGNSARPAHPSAYCKAILGWATPILLSGSLIDAEFPPVELQPVIFSLPANHADPFPTEWWLIENRQPFGFDDYLPGYGLCIYHCDATVPNNADQYRYRVAMEQADGFNSLAFGGSQGDPGDPFPGSSDNRSFFDFSVPSAYINDGAVSRVAIWEISDSDSLMFADLTAVSHRPFAAFEEGNTFWFDETDGDNDGILEGGETISFNCSLYSLDNVGYGAIVSLSCDAPGIQFVSNDQYVTGYLSPYFEVELEEPIVFEIPETFLTRRVNFTLQLAMDTVYQEFEYGLIQELTFDTILAQMQTDVGEVGDGLTIPERFEVLPNYPNPFNPTTVIRFAIPRDEQGHKASHTRLEVINNLGQPVAVLVDKTLPPGLYEIDWDGTDDQGRTVASGVYFYRLSRGTEQATRKMLLVK